MSGKGKSCFDSNHRPRPSKRNTAFFPSLDVSLLSDSDNHDRLCLTCFISFQQFLKPFVSREAYESVFFSSLAKTIYKKAISVNEKCEGSKRTKDDIDLILDSLDQNQQPTTSVVQPQKVHQQEQQYFLQPSIDFYNATLPTSNFVSSSNPI